MPTNRSRDLVIGALITRRPAVSCVDQACGKPVAIRSVIEGRVGLINAANAALTRVSNVLLFISCALPAAGWVVADPYRKITLGRIP